MCQLPSWHLAKTPKLLITSAYHASSYILSYISGDKNTISDQGAGGVSIAGRHASPYGLSLTEFFYKFATGFFTVFAQSAKRSGYLVPWSHRTVGSPLIRQSGINLET